MDPANPSCSLPLPPMYSPETERHTWHEEEGVVERHHARDAAETHRRGTAENYPGVTLAVEERREKKKRYRHEDAAMVIRKAANSWYPLWSNASSTKSEMFGRR